VSSPDKDDSHNEDNDDKELALFLHKCRNELLKKGYMREQSVLLKKKKSI
jgi:hypothetical protein